MRQERELRKEVKKVELARCQAEDKRCLKYAKFAELLTVDQALSFLGTTAAVQTKPKPAIEEQTNCSHSASRHGIQTKKDRHHQPSSLGPSQTVRTAISAAHESQSYPNGPVMRTRAVSAVRVQISAHGSFGAGASALIPVPQRRRALA